MSRLLNPGIGEITDRLTILALKIRYGLDAGKEVSHFQRERAGLLAKVRSATLNGSWFESMLELGAVNAALWQKTDAMRGYLLDHDAGSGRPVSAGALFEDAAKCGMAILRLNDERARLVGVINYQVGDGFEEKL